MAAYDFASFTGLSRYCRETIGVGFRRGRVRHRRASGLTNMSLCCRAGWYLHEKSKIRLCKQPGGAAAERDADLESSQRLVSREREKEQQRSTSIVANTPYIFSLFTSFSTCNVSPPVLQRFPADLISPISVFLHPLYLPTQPSPAFLHHFCLLLNRWLLDCVKCHSAEVPVVSESP